ncbi:ribonuclease H-like domain-containing protein [Tanacetum coccineum]
MTGSAIPTKQPINKAYSIASIKACIPTPFDQDKLNYNSWSALFKRFCKTYDVQHHLDAPPTTTTTSTAPVDPYNNVNDSLVVIWMYSTISPKLVDMVIDDSATTRGVWERLKNIFHDNKDARVIQLDNEIHNMSIGNLSVRDYFQEIKGKANRLANLGSTENESLQQTSAMSSFHNSSSTPTVLVAANTSPVTMSTLGLDQCRNFQRGPSNAASVCMPQAHMATHVLPAQQVPTMHPAGVPAQQAQPMPSVSYTVPQSNVSTYYPQPQFGFSVIGGYPYASSSMYPSQATMLPQAFRTMTLQDPTWNMDTGASSHFADNTCMLSSFSNPSIYKSVFVGNGQSIPVTNTGHSLLYTRHKPLHLHHILVTPNIIKNLIFVRKFTRVNDVSVEFDACGFSVKDYQTRGLLLRCDSTEDLYPVTHQPSSPGTFALLSLSHTTWHRRLGHPGEDVLRRLESSRFISCNKSKSSALCHACQLVTKIIPTPPVPVTTSLDTLPTPTSTQEDTPMHNITHQLPTSSPQVTYDPDPRTPLPNSTQHTHDQQPQSRRTWALVPRPANVNVVCSMWLFRHKFNGDGSLSRYKARLAANGRSQQQGIDCDETFSPVVKPSTIRTILSLAVLGEWHIHQLDCSLYGLKQAPRAWFQRFASFVTRIGFQHSKIDTSLFVFNRGSDIAYLLLYVDDIVLTASSAALLQHIITSLHNEFAMTDLGSLNYFLGISSQRSASGMFLSQSKFVEEITLYRSLAGALQYLTFTCPDLSYAVQQISLYMHDPREPHFTALKRILRYVRSTLDYGLQLHVSFTAQLTAYTDVDWVGCPVTRRSTSGYCVFLGDNLLSWFAKQQVTLSRSSAEAEYRGIANVVVETVWIRNLLRELHTYLFTATLVYCDNVGAVYMSANPVQHQRTKHIEIDIHFVRDFVASGQVRVLHVPSRFQYADIFTKGLPTALFLEFRSSLNVRRPPAQPTGEY